MRVEIITPETEIFKGEADAVQLPGLDGSFQVLNNHAPIISALAEGAVKIDLTDDHQIYEKMSGQIEHDASDDKVIRINIKGGIMEMMNNKVIILAE